MCCVCLLGKVIIRKLSLVLNTSAGLKRFDFSVFTTRGRRTTVRLEYKDISEATPQFGTTAGLQVTFVL